MKVIHNATNALYEKAEELSQQPHESWRSVYFKLADKPEKKNQTLYNNFVFEPITDILGDMQGYIYQCGDADIVILFQGALLPVLSKLSHHFADINPRQLDRTDSDMVRVFDLGKQWNEFYAICEEKYHDSLVFEEEAHRSAHPQLYANGNYLLTGKSA